MSKDVLRYDRMLDAAHRGIVREALNHVAERGLPGSHHFYISFRTAAAGVVVPDFLRERYPDDMTIVLEHQFEQLVADETGFSVTLWFKNRPERLTIPWASLTAFADPSVKFGLQFQVDAARPAPAKAKPPVPAVAAPSRAGEEDEAGAKAAAQRDGAPADGKKAADVVTLDSFRKK